MLWLRYESFSILCDVFCQKGSFPVKTAVFVFHLFVQSSPLEILPYPAN